jgi:hypothetical protein
MSVILQNINKPKILDYFEFNEEHLYYLKEENHKISFKLKCKLCSTIKSANIRTNSNWVAHLREKHTSEYKKYKENVDTKINDDNKQQKITNNVVKEYKYSYNHPYQILLDKKLVIMIIKGSLSLIIVEHYAFRDFVKTLHPSYRLCYRNRIVNLLIPKLYKSLDNKIRSELNSALTVAISVDAWTDKRQKAFLAITSHIINENWEA